VKFHQRFKYSERKVKQFSNVHIEDFLLSTTLLPHACVPIPGVGNYSVVGQAFHLQRQYGLYVIKSFMPTFALVLMASISFKIPGIAIPGRMALLITIFLVLVNIANSTEDHFSSNGLNALDIWLRVCMAFVACAIGEYAIVLSIIYKGSCKVKASNSLHRTKNYGNKGPGAAAALDKKSLLIFLFSFCIFNFIYWSHYLL